MTYIKCHFLPIHFMKVGDIFETHNGNEFTVLEVFGREPFYHRYFYSVRTEFGGSFLWNNTASHCIKRVYRDNRLIWITSGECTNHPWIIPRIMSHKN